MEDSNWSFWLIMILTTAGVIFFISEMRKDEPVKETPPQNNIVSEKVEQPSKEELKRKWCSDSEPFSIKGDEFLYGAGSSIVHGMVEISKKSIWNKNIPVVSIKILDATKDFKKAFSKPHSNIKHDGGFILFPLGEFADDRLVTTAYVDASTRKGIIQAIGSRRQIGLKLTLLSANSPIENHERVIAPNDTPACQIDWVEIPRGERL